MSIFLLRPPFLPLRASLCSILFFASFVSPARAAESPAPSRTPFAPASVATGRTLFTRLDADAIGIDARNPYDDPLMWSSRYRAFMGGGLGSGLAAADFDGDGRTDLYVSTKTRPGRLYRNLGGWRFADVTDAAGLAESDSLLGWLKDTVSSRPVVWRQGVVFADVNNDRHPDLYVCRNNAPNLLYINQGNGTFKEEAEARGLAVVDGSVIAAFADFDRDGWLDAFVLTNQVDGTEPEGRPDRLFRNTGNGRFVEVTTRAGIAGPTFGHSATVIDFDADGWPDVYVANDFSGPDRLYRNNRDFTFTNVLDAVVPHTPLSSMGADLADIDNNGHFDLFVADMATTTRERDRRGLIASRDDIIRLATVPGATPQYTRNALLMNSGRGVFAEAAAWAGLEATDWTWSVRFEDFDNDGWADLHVTNGMVREPNNIDLLAQMMRAVSDQQRIAVMQKSPPLAEANLAYRNLAGTGFASVGPEWGLDEVGVSFGAATADFDHDGDLDLATLAMDGGVSLFRNDVAGRHRIQFRLRGTKSNRHGVGAVVRIESESAGRQSQALTVSRGYASGSDLIAHFGLGPDTVVRRAIIEWPSGARQEFAGLAADFAYSITEDATATPPAPDNGVARGRFRVRTQELGLDLRDESAPAMPDREQAFLPFRTDRRGPGVAVGDLDGNGHDDLYVAATTGSPARVLRWRQGRFATEAPVGVTPGKVEDGPPLLADFDGNGTRDLLVTKASANASAWPDAFRPVLYANDGAGRFTATDALPPLSINVGAAAAGDFDGDGDPDLFLGGRSVPGRYPETPASVLLRNDGGRFVDVTAIAGLGAIGLVKAALFEDVDRDGATDLIVALEWGPVRYLHNDGDGRFSDWTEKAGFASGGRGWWNSLASGDFNGDGRADFVAGNLGLNTTYRASPEQPVTLFHGDFARNGTKLLLEAVYDSGTLYPVRGRSDLGGRLPFVLRKYPKNDDFARATLADVFGEPALAAAAKFTADNLASGVFLSQADGTYRFAALPRTAQLGAMQGIAVTDFDGDGHLDIAAAQNADIAIPAYHGGVGVLLRGDGRGAFTPVAADESGFVAPGNGRALVVIDPDRNGRPDLFLTRHGGPAEFFSNEGPAATRRASQMAPSAVVAP